MTFPFTPLLTAAELGTYLGDSSIDPARAEMMIDDAQMLCLSVVDPLPDGAEIIVRRIAARAYISAPSARAAALAAQGAGGPGSSALGGGPWLSNQDIADLRRMNSGGNAFTINPLASTYAPLLPVWDEQGVTAEVDTS